MPVSRSKVRQLATGDHGDYRGWRMQADVQQNSRTRGDRHQTRFSRQARPSSHLPNRDQKNFLNSLARLFVQIIWTLSRYIFLRPSHEPLQA